MNIYTTTEFKTLNTFLNRKEQLAVVEREVPLEAEHFFQYLKRESFDASGKVMKNTAETDIRAVLQNVISKDLQAHAFYEKWIADMADVCKHFCVMYESKAVGFWLGSKRGCRRYHVDNVPMRALVTYAGKGTEYIPDEAADRRAFQTGARNEEIIKDASAIRHINVWDVAIFRGGAQGLLHRTPDVALNGGSILMRLDDPSYWNT